MQIVIATPSLSSHFQCFPFFTIFRERSAAGTLLVLNYKPITAVFLNMSNIQLQSERAVIMPKPNRPPWPQIIPTRREVLKGVGNVYLENVHLDIIQTQHNILSLKLK